MSTPAQEKLLNALAENSLVKAALVLGANGQIKSKRGAAEMLERHTRDKQVPPPKPTENLYLIELTEDILAVVFEDGVEFESLRRTVGTLIEHAGLKVANPPGDDSED